jgi:hypothetical protein
MTYRSNNCPLPADIPGVATVEFNGLQADFHGYLVVLRGTQPKCRCGSRRVLFEYYQDGVLYAVPVE